MWGARLGFDIVQKSQCPKMVSSLSSTTFVIIVMFMLQIFPDAIALRRWQPRCFGHWIMMSDVGMLTLELDRCDEYAALDAYFAGNPSRRSKDESFSHEPSSTWFRTSRAGLGGAVLNAKG